MRGGEEQGGGGGVRDAKHRWLGFQVMAEGRWGVGGERKAIPLTFHPFDRIRPILSGWEETVAIVDKVYN